MGCLPRTPLVHEDQRLTHFARALQARINKSLCGGGDTLDVQWTNFLFVDQNDPGPLPVPTGERNYWTDKFETIQSAVNAAQDGDVIYINPGTYIENLDLSNMADNVTIMGSGREATIISNSNDTTPTILVDPSSALLGLTFRDLTIQNTDNNIAVVVDCEDALGSFTDNFLNFDRVVIVTDTGGQGNALDIRYVNRVTTEHLWIPQSGIYLYNTNIHSYNTEIDGASQIDYDLTDVTQTTVGREVSVFRDTYIHGESITLWNQPSVHFNKGCEVEVFLGTVSRISGDVADLPYIHFHGDLTRVSMLFDSNGEWAQCNIAWFDEAIIENDFIFNSAAGNATEYHVWAENAVFKTTSSGVIQCDIAAEQKGHLHMLGAEFTQVALNTNNHGVDRTLHYIDVTALTEGVGPNVIAISPPYIGVGVDYTVHPELVDDGVNYPNISIVAASKNVNNFDCRCGAAPVSAAFRLIMQNQI